MNRLKNAISILGMAAALIMAVGCRNEFSPRPESNNRVDMGLAYPSSDEPIAMSPGLDLRRAVVTDFSEQIPVELIESVSFTLTGDDIAADIAELPMGGAKSAEGPAMIATFQLAEGSDGAACAAGPVVGQFFLELDEKGELVSVQPATVRLTEEALAVLTGGQATICLGLESNFSGEVWLAGITVSVQLPSGVSLDDIPQGVADDIAQEIPQPEVRPDALSVNGNDNDDNSNDNSGGNTNSNDNSGNSNSNDNSGGNTNSNDNSGGNTNSNDNSGGNTNSNDNTGGNTNDNSGGNTNDNFGGNTNSNDNSGNTNSNDNSGGNTNSNDNTGGNTNTNSNDNSGGNTNSNDNGNTNGNSNGNANDNSSGLTVLFSTPPNNSIDARQPFPPSGGTMQGWDVVEITMSGSAAGLSPSDFSITYQGAPGDVPSITSVQANGNTVIVNLSYPIPTLGWTTIIHNASGGWVRLGYLPGDVNGDRTASSVDVLALVDFLNGVTNLPMHQVDVDRSGQPNPADILRVIDLLNGADSLPEFFFASLPGDNGNTNGNTNSNDNTGGNVNGNDNGSGNTNTNDNSGGNVNGNDNGSGNTNDNSGNTNSNDNSGGNTNTNDNSGGNTNSNDNSGGNTNSNDNSGGNTNDNSGGNMNDNSGGNTNTNDNSGNTNANDNSGGNTNDNSGGNTNSNDNSGGNTNTNDNSGGNTNSNDNSGGNTNSNDNSGGNTNSNDNSGGNTNSNDNGNTNGNANANDNGNTNGNTNGNANDNSGGSTCPDGEVRLHASLSGGSQSGGANYRRETDGRRRFDLSVSGYSAGSYNIVVNGVVVGQVSVGGSGSGSVDWDTNDGNFPGNFPNILSGATITVGNATGTFSLNCS